MFLPGLYNDFFPRPQCAMPVAGMTCVKPIAPAELSAWGLNLDSTSINENAKGNGMPSWVAILLIEVAKVRGMLCRSALMRSYSLWIRVTVESSGFTCERV